jgi:gliding motility-associated-like protein
MCTSGNPATSNVIIMIVNSLPEVAITQVNVLCKGGSNGSITVEATGGLAPYRFSIDGGTQQPSNVFTGLTAGNYSISVIDANDCVVNVQVDITEPAELRISYTVTPAECPDSDDGEIELQISGGLQPYTVIWEDGNTSLRRTGLKPDTYRVVVTDLNGCQASVTITVGFSGTGICLEIQDVITPNGDGFNDTWKIKNIELFPNAEVFVYNRWGDLVFRTRNISANEWDGTSRGRLLPTDSYHYILYLNDGSKPRSGVVSIIR